MTHDETKDLLVWTKISMKEQMDTYIEVGEDGIDVGEREPTLVPRCCEG